MPPLAIPAEAYRVAFTRGKMTDAEKGDAVNYEPGDLLQFHQNAPGHPKGSRLVVGGTDRPPVGYADRFEVYRPARLSLAAGDRVRVTANGTTRDGKHALRNGAIYTVRGFTPRATPSSTTAGSSTRTSGTWPTGTW